MIQLNNSHDMGEAARALYEELKKLKNDQDYTLFIHTPEESKAHGYVEGWAVCWEGGPDNWAANLSLGESFEGIEYDTEDESCSWDIGPYSGCYLFFHEDMSAQRGTRALNDILPLDLGKVTMSQGTAFGAGLGRDEQEPEHVTFMAFVQDCINRHRRVDWGDVSKADADRNVQALLDDDRILSAYESEKYEKLYIITEHDRSYSTVMFVSEY